MFPNAMLVTALLATSPNTKILPRAMLEGMQGQIDELTTQVDNSRLKSIARIEDSIKNNKAEIERMKKANGQQYDNLIKEREKLAIKLEQLLDRVKK